MGGSVRMTSLIINPSYRDAPTLSCNRMQMKGKDSLRIEMFDTDFVKAGYDVRQIVHSKRKAEKKEKKCRILRIFGS